MPKSTLPIDRIRRLVGPITEEQLRYIDSYAGRHVVLFMPAGGACFFALTPDHCHPAYMFILPFDDHTALVFNGKSIAVRPGHIFALSPGIEHHEVPSEIPPRYIAAFVDRDLFDAEFARYPERLPETLAGGHYQAPAELLPLLQRFIVNDPHQQ